jgi:hypothetical protein
MNTHQAKRRGSRVSALITTPLIGLVFVSLAHSTAVRTDDSDQQFALFPSDRYTVPDQNQVTGLRVALRKPDCSVHVSDCEDVDVVNQLDGFNVQPRIVIPFSGAIDLATVNRQGVYLLEVGSSRRVALNQLQWHQPSHTLVGAPDELLRQHQRYLLVVTDDVRDSNGTRIEPAPFWAANAAARPTEADRRYNSALGEALRRAGIHREHVAAASLFTTQSVTADLEKIQAQITRATPSAIDFRIGADPTKSDQADGGAVPAVFSVESTAAIKWHRQTGTGSGAEPVFTEDKVSFDRIALAPGSIAKIAFGRFSSPEYRSAGLNAIPTYPTRNGQPIVQRLVPLVVEIFIPSGPRPSRGWPVALMGHGAGESIYNDAWAIAPQLAAAGIATAAIHYAGHGGGERGTLEVVGRDGRVVVVPSGGRGIDQDGDGRIGPLEGLYATPPAAIVVGRDGTRQTVIDLMQLVREIQVGVDVEGDGHVDLDATRITYIGHSAGAIYGTVLLAIEPSIAAGALTAGGGPSVDIGRLGVGGVRRRLGEAVAARTPSLLNATIVNDPAKASLAFIDNIPLRNQPVAVHSTPGAMEIQQLFDRMSWVSQAANPVAYAPYLRHSPLPGHPTKRVLLQFARGDRTVTNPTTTALIRAGQLTDRTTLYRADLAQTSDPRDMPKNPHNFLLDGVDTAERPFALAAQRQIAIFLKTEGVQTIDPDGDGPVFETPIKGPLPEDLGFLP